MPASVYSDERTAAAGVFAALGDPIRLSLVRRLAEQSPLSATRLGDGLPVTRQAVAKHLRVLTDAGILSARKRGRERLYSLEAERVRQAREALDDIAAGWDRALQRLRAHVERGDTD
ncbi:ArsR/SmtB family transcription factor [Haliangium sp.]|uniref:ArsR/SmtB family transcription factor n=1 Tax=Haliangium sp. TaxID=2663208 RepID=UPI003D09C96E